MPSPSDGKPLPLEVITHFLENQTRELDLRKQEDETKRQLIKSNTELAKASMQAQKENLKNAREHREALWARWLLFGGFVVVVAAILIGWSLWLGKEQFILEVLRVVTYGGSGIAIGSYYQKSKNLNSQNDNKE